MLFFTTLTLQIPYSPNLWYSISEQCKWNLSLHYTACRITNYPQQSLLSSSHSYTVLLVATYKSRGLHLKLIFSYIFFLFFLDKKESHFLFSLLLILKYLPYYKWYYSFVFSSPYYSFVSFRLFCNLSSRFSGHSFYFSTPIPQCSFKTLRIIYKTPTFTLVVFHDWWQSF